MKQSSFFWIASLALAMTVLVNPAFAACSNPAGSKGDIMYNADYRIPQYCDGTDWHAMGESAQGCTGPADCPNPGNVCADGTKFGGCTAGGDGHKIFVARCAASSTWNGSSCVGSATTIEWNNANTSGYVTTGATSSWDGRANTEILIATDSDSVTGGVQPHKAAQWCADLTDNGYDDWYLPAVGEFFTLNALGVLVSDAWTSTEVSSTQANYTSLGGGGAFQATTKSNSGSGYYRTYCVRRRD